MSKKPQAAMEFIITYGWAILVVLSAIGSLYYFGVLDPNKFTYKNNTNQTEQAQELVSKYMNETDGIKTNGFLCYANEGNTVERQSYIMIHELCHRMVDEDKKHFCDNG